MTDLMSQGFNLALLGMGTVFFFLTLLVGVTMAMSALIPNDEVLMVEEVPNDGVEPRIQAVIAAAIFRHRNKDQ